MTDPSRARGRHAGPRRQRMARRSRTTTCFRPISTALDALIARSGRGKRGLGRHVDGRAARHRHRGAAEHARSRGSSSTTSDPVIEPAALDAHPRLLRRRPDLRDVRRDRRSTCARFRRRSARSPTRSGSTSPAPTSGNAPTAAGGSPTIPASPCRFVPRAAPPDLWALWDAIRCPTLVLRGAKSDLLVVRDGGADGRTRPEARGDRVRRASATRRCCCRPTRSIRWRISCAADAQRRPLAADGAARPSGKLPSLPRARGTIRRHPLQSIGHAHDRHAPSQPSAARPASGESAGNPPGASRSVARRVC